MDLSAVLAYKSLFFFNRARNTSNQAQKGQKFTAATNIVRCGITASQTVVPLYAVSKCLATTAANPTVKNAAEKISNSSLQKIATAMTSSTTQSALDSITKITKFLAKIGIAANIAYATAKCLDAEEKDKTKVCLRAAGNLGCMYLFEHIYSVAVKNLSSDGIINSAGSPTVSKTFTTLKAIKPVSILLGLGFVAASLFGCSLGEKLGEKLYVMGSKPLLQPAEQPINTPVNNNIEMLA